MTFDYERDTRLKYRDEKLAQQYKVGYSAGISFARLTSRRIEKCIERILREYGALEKLVLDMPCGTGFLADVLLKDNKVVAADISLEMMGIAIEDYGEERFLGFVQADCVAMPFKRNAFDMIISLGLMHRVPDEMKRRILLELAMASRRYIIITFSIADYVQKFKYAVLRRLTMGHRLSPAPIVFRNLKMEFETAGLEIVRRYKALPFLSSQFVFVLRKKQSADVT